MKCAQFEQSRKVLLKRGGGGTVMKNVLSFKSLFPGVYTGINPKQNYTSKYFIRFFWEYSTFQIYLGFFPDTQKYWKLPEIVRITICKFLGTLCPPLLPSFPFVPVLLCCGFLWASQAACMYSSVSLYLFLVSKVLLGSNATGFNTETYITWHLLTELFM